MPQDTTLPALPVARSNDRRLVLVLVLVGVAFVLLLLNLVGSARTLNLIRRASPTFVVLLLAAQAFRYAGSAWSTQILAKIFGQRLPFWPLYQAMIGGQAMNRTFSVGGAAGLFVRYSFLTRQGLHSGAFASLILVEDVIGAMTVALVFAAGLALVVVNAALPQFGGRIAAAFLGGALLLAAAMAYAYHRRRVVERGVHLLARVVDVVVARLIGKSIYERRHVQLAIDEFYIGVAQARRDPLRLAWAFLFNLLRVVVDAASLYFAFLAIGLAVAPGALLIIFTTASALSTLSSAPGELGVMETALAVISTAWGIAPPIAVSAILLYRALSYWLPIPVGYIACWNLQRRGFI